MNLLNLGDYASFYFFSALFQGNSALLALSAMFIIYTRQSIENNIFKLEKIITDYLRSSSNIAINYGSVLSLESYNEQHFRNLDEAARKKIKNAMTEDAWKKRFKELKGLINKNNNLWNEARRPMVSMLVILIVSTIILPFSNVLHEVKPFELIVIVIVMTAEIISLFILFNFIKAQSNDKLLKFDSLT